jgi:hypothetical protein
MALIVETPAKQEKLEMHPENINEDTLVGGVASYYELDSAPEQGLTNSSCMVEEGEKGRR